MSSGSCKQGREQERGEGAIRGGLEIVGTDLKPPIKTTTAGFSGRQGKARCIDRVGLSGCWEEKSQTGGYQASELAVRGVTVRTHGGLTRAVGEEKEILTDPRAPTNVKGADFADGSPIGSDGEGGTREDLLGFCFGETGRL